MRRETNPRDEIWTALLTSEGAVTVHDLAEATGESRSECQDVLFKALDDDVVVAVELEPCRKFEVVA